MRKEKIADWQSLEPAKPAHALVENVDLVIINSVVHRHQFNGSHTQIYKVIQPSPGRGGELSDVVEGRVARGEVVEVGNVHSRKRGVGALGRSLDSAY